MCAFSGAENNLRGTRKQRESKTEECEDRAKSKTGNRQGRHRGSQRGDQTTELTKVVEKVKSRTVRNVCVEMKLERVIKREHASEMCAWDLRE